VSRLNTRTGEPTTLPTSAFTVVAMWAGLETLLIILTEDGNSSDGFEMVIRPLMQGGILASMLMVAAWLVFGTDVPGNACRLDTSRRRWFCVFVVSTTLLVILVLTLSTSRTATEQSLAIAGILMSTAGAMVPWMLIRNYFRFRLIHRQDETLKTDRRSEVTIQNLMVITAVLAGLLAACRLLVGELDTETVRLGVSRCLLGLIWWATAIWLLGRRRFIFITLAVLVASQLIGAFMEWPDSNSSGDAVIISVWMLFGVQLHLLLFLATMRAGEFRFARVR